MKILQLCNKIPYPPYDGGAVAMLNMAKSFAKNGLKVTILAISTDKHKISATQIPQQKNKIYLYRCQYKNQFVEAFFQSYIFKTTL